MAWATQASKPPGGPQWIREIKHDGSRLIARKRDGSRVPIARVNVECLTGFGGVAVTSHFAIGQGAHNPVIARVPVLARHAKRSAAPPLA
jgi:hypothetical protein